MTETNQPEVRSCGFLIVRETPNLSFLLMKHSARWDLPKGHVDPGETDLECALRELWEETGIKRSDIRIDDGFQFVHQYSVRLKRYNNKLTCKELVIYLATLTNDVQIKPTEHQGFAWLPWQPPHTIQELTIDPLLESLAEYWASSDPERNRSNTSLE